MNAENAQSEKFESWGLLELFGHQRLAGLISEATLGGCHFLRIDVPAVGETPQYSRFYTQGAIYAMTPLDESTARRLATALHARPVYAYEVEARALPSGRREADEDDDPDYYDESEED